MSAAIKISAPKTVDDYIEKFSPKVQALLRKLRRTIKAAAPEAEEKISYQIAGYKYHGMLIYFAAHKNHIGLYPAPRSVDAFKKELAAYKGAKSTVQFPLDKSIPADLVTRIVKYRAKENEGRSAAKNKTTTGPARIKNKASKLTDEERVAGYMKKLNHPMKAETEAVRSIIKNSNKKLSERIKWNAPSYYYKEDIVTFGPYKNNKVLLVFHHPLIIKIKSPLLEGDYKDRRLAYFENMDSIKKNKKELSRIMNELIERIDK